MSDNSDVKVIGLNNLKKQYPNVANILRLKVIHYGCKGKKNGKRYTHEEIANKCAVIINESGKEVTYKISTQAVTRILAKVRHQEALSQSQLEMLRAFFSRQAEDDGPGLILSPNTFLSIMLNDKNTMLYTPKISKSQLMQQLSGLGIAPRIPYGFSKRDFFIYQSKQMKNPKEGFRNGSKDSQGNNNTKRNYEASNIRLSSSDFRAKNKEMLYCFIKSIENNRPMKGDENSKTIIDKGNFVFIVRDCQSNSNNFYFSAFHISSSEEDKIETNFVSHVVEPMTQDTYRKNDGIFPSSERQKKLQDKLPVATDEQSRRKKVNNICMLFDRYEMERLKESHEKEYEYIIKELAKTGIAYVSAPPSNQAKQKVRNKSNMAKPGQQIAKNNSSGPKNVYLSEEENKNLTRYCQLMCITKADAILSFFTNFILEFGPVPYLNREDKSRIYDNVYFNEYLEWINSSSVKAANKLATSVFAPNITDNISLILKCITKYSTGYSKKPTLKTLYRYIISNELERIYKDLQSGGLGVGEFWDFIKSLPGAKKDPAEAWKEFFEQKTGLRWSSYVKYAGTIDYPSLRWLSESCLSATGDLD